jgi:hypothetical protein
VLSNGDEYLSKKDEEMEYHLKHLPEQAKRQLQQAKLDPDKFDIIEEQIPDQPLPDKQLDLVYNPDEDTPCIRNNQRYFLITYLRGGKSAERDWYRVWCACSSTGDVKRAIEKIREENPYAQWWDIAVLPAGGWAPWPPGEAEQQEYANKEMNEFMGKHMENLGKALKHDQERKSNLQAQEDVNVQVRKEKALKKKHKKWLKRQRERAAQLGCTVDELIENEGKAEQYRIALGGEQPKWDGDLSKPEEYELYTVVEEKTLDDGTVQLIEKTVRKRKMSDEQRRLQELQNAEKRLLHQVAQLELRLETYGMALQRMGIDERSIPELQLSQVQRLTEPRESQAVKAVAAAKEQWKQERK